MDYNYYKELEITNGKKLIVKNLMPQDAEGMISLIRTADTESRFLSREIGEFNYSLEQERKLIADRLKDDNSFWIVGELDGKIIANCDTCRVNNKKRYIHRAAIAIVVLKDFWGLGIGKILMKESIKWSKNKGFEQLELDVLSGNERAIYLYKSLGFEKTGTKKNAIKYPDDTYADEYVMRLLL